MHQFVLDYLEFILAAIVIAQAIILAKSQLFDTFILKHLRIIYAVIKAQVKLNEAFCQDIDECLSKNPKNN